MSLSNTKRWLIPLGGVLVLLAVVGLAQGWFRFWPFGEDSSVTDMMVQKRLDENIEHSLISFERSKATPVFESDTFPVLDYPVVRGHPPDWTKPAIIVFGADFTYEFYEVLKEIPIQKIHVICIGEELNPTNVEKFPDDVTILDALEGQLTEGFNVPESVYQKTGINGFAGYLINEERKVLFAKVNRGDLSADILRVSKEFLASGELKEGTSQIIPPVGKPLPMDAVPAEFQDEIQAELSKPIALVFFSDDTWCDTCKNWLAGGKKFIEQWREKDYGLLLVEGGRKNFALERQSDGVLRLSDIHKENFNNESVVSASWGVMPIPETYILKNGHLQGRVGWLEMEINGKTYRDLHFRVIDKILAQ